MSPSLLARSGRGFKHDRRTSPVIAAFNTERHGSPVLTTPLANCDRRRRPAWDSARFARPRVRASRARWPRCRRTADAELPMVQLPSLSGRCGSSDRRPEPARCIGIVSSRGPAHAPRFRRRASPLFAGHRAWPDRTLRPYAAVAAGLARRARRVRPELSRSTSAVTGLSLRARLPALTVAMGISPLAAT
jgi:hypothetical protein